MKILYFLADHIFRFKYQDPSSEKNGVPVWDLDVYEKEQNKMLFDFFLMGFIIGAVLEMIVAVIVWLSVL